MAQAKLDPLQFIKEARTELAKVVWPTREETIKLTALVIIITVAIGAYIGTIDYLLSQVLKLLIRLK